MSVATYLGALRTNAITSGQTGVTNPAPTPNVAEPSIVQKATQASTYGEGLEGLFSALPHTPTAAIEELDAKVPAGPLGGAVPGKEQIITTTKGWGAKVRKAFAVKA